MGLPIRQGLVIATIAAIGGTLVLIVVGARHEREGSGPAVPSASAPGREPPAAGPDELRLLAPLVVGADLGGFTVRRIRGVEGGVLRLSCARGREVVRLDVALAGDGPDGGEGPPPPATAGRYAIFYALVGAVPEDGERLARLLGRVIEGNAGAPAPAGMTTFAPAPKPAISL